MSDIFFAAGLRCNIEGVAKHLCWTQQSKAWLGKLDGLIWVATRIDSPVLWAPAYDAQSGIRAILGGRIAPEEADWKAAEGLPYEGGLASRLVIDRWLKGGTRAIEAMNGSAQIIIIDERQCKLHVWTDRVGFYPAFAWTADGAFLFCSHPDVAADALERTGHSLKFDALTMAEFLRTGTSVHPHTYWQGIRQLDAATHFELDFGSKPRVLASSVYWQPAYLRGEPYLTDRREIVDKLSVALKSAVQRRTLPRLGKVAVLLSAGADSRTALFGACDPAGVTCYSVYDEPNAELTGAKQLANAAGARHIEFPRSKDYYLDQGPDAVRLSGGMWSIDSAHFGGLTSRIRSHGCDVVLTGCYADYLLKGLSYNRRNKSVLGKFLPLYDFAESRSEWYQPFSEIAGQWQARVERRTEERYLPFDGDDRSRSRLEYLRLAPMMREADVSGRLILRRTCGHDYIFADHDVLDMVFAIAPREKLNGIAFGMAVERITGNRAAHVKNNNYNARVGASEIERVSAFVLASLKRKITGQGGGQPYEKDPASVATVGSWPYFPRVIKMSERARAWRASLPEDQEEFLFDVLGEERRKWSVEDWADRESSLFLRVYTASLWLSQNGHALSRIATA